MLQTISSVTVTNVFIVSRRGKILGSSLNELLKSERIINMLEERHIPSEYTENLWMLNKHNLTLTLIMF